MQERLIKNSYTTPYKKNHRAENGWTFGIYGNNDCHINYLSIRRIMKESFLYKIIFKSIVGGSS